MIKVKVVFFASFKERLDCAELTLELNSDSNIQDLCDLLAGKGNRWYELFSEAKKYLKIACNQQMVEIDHGLNDGDEVAFFPPVTGG